MKSVELLILSAVRTPIGGFLGDLAACTGPQLGAAALCIGGEATTLAVEMV